MAGTQLIRMDERANVVKQLFKDNSERMIKMAPRTLGDPQRLLTIAFNTIAFDDKLVQCTPQSLIGGVFEALKLGVALGGPMQEAWLIPFRNSKINAFEATFIVGFQGYRNILDRGRGVIDVHPRAVYAGDEFDMQYGTPRDKISHRPYWMLGKTEKDKGQLMCVYAIANLRGGGQQIEVMPRAEVDAHRARSRAKDSGPWVSDYDAMALKTVIRKIAKYLPKSNELLARALDLDDKADRGVPQDFDVTGLVMPAEAQAGPKKPALDQLTDRVVGTQETSESTGGELSPEENARLDAELAAEEAKNNPQ